MSVADATWSSKSEVDWLNGRASASYLDLASWKQAEGSGFESQVDRSCKEPFKHQGQIPCLIFCLLDGLQTFTKVPRQFTSSLDAIWAQRLEMQFVARRDLEIFADLTGSFFVEGNIRGAEI